jgi:hypothetical protein
MTEGQQQAKRARRREPPAPATCPTCGAELERAGEWIFYRHPYGQWVTLRRATLDELAGAARGRPPPGHPRVRKY